MFKIRKEQQQVFQKRAAAQFESNALQHLRRDLAEQTKAYTDEQLRTRVNDCIPRAAAYGLMSQKQLMCFVDVSFLLGEHFDADPQHRWSKELLESTKVSALDKGNLLLATACSCYQDPSYPKSRV